MSKITNRIFLGSYEDSLDENFLEKNNIGLVINLAIELDKPKWNYLKSKKKEPEYIKYSLYDIPQQPIFDVIIDVYKKVNYYLKTTKKNILIHCRAGISRSSTVVIGILMLLNNKSAEEVYKYVKSKRKIINPNIGFINDLLKLDKIIKDL